MNLDESLLSGYLDDEVDPATRRLVDDSIATDPSLRERLGVLAANRDLVAGLARPAAPSGLVAGVMARVESSQTSRRRRPYYWLATAASIGFALILHRIGGESTVRPVRVTDPATLTIAKRPSAPSERSEIQPTSIAVTTATAPNPSPLGPVDDPSEPARRRLISMLDRRGASRILVVTDVLDPAARERVNALLRETPRKNPDFGRLTIAQGLLVDSENPNEAEVYPVVMDERERLQFLAKLNNEFTTVIDEPNLDPTLGMHLAEVGEVKLESGRAAAAGLGNPPDETAIQAVRTHNPMSDLPSGPSNGDDDPHVPLERNDVASRSSPAASPGAIAAVHAVKPGPNARVGSVRPRAVRPEPPALVLVWVTSYEPARYRE
jgi:hypothetical protein